MKKFDKTWKLGVAQMFGLHVGPLYGKKERLDEWPEDTVAKELG